MCIVQANKHAYRYLCGFKNDTHTSTDASLSQEKFHDMAEFRDEFWRTSSPTFAYAPAVRRMSELSSARKSLEISKARFSLFVKLSIEPLFRPKYSVFSALTKLVKRKRREEKQPCDDDDMDIVRRDISCSTSIK